MKDHSLKEKAKSQKWLAVVPEKTLPKSILPVNHLGQMTDQWFSKFVHSGPLNTFKN